METAEKTAPEKREPETQKSSQAPPTPQEEGEPILLEPDVDFIQTLQELGSESHKKCFQCATCSAACPISSEIKPFPRKEMAWAAWGMKEQLIGDPDIWVCHYCGDCSTLCPRGANPGELMMALRRCAITRYDWTGLSRRLYSSIWWEIGALLAVALVVVGLFAASGAFSAERMISTHVAERTFIPWRWVHYGDWTLAGLLTFCLFVNSFRMSRIVLRGQKIPPSVFLSELKVFLIHSITQKNWRSCNEPTPWLKHFILFTGYVTMFVLVMFFLPFLEVDTSRFTWVSLLGYYATVVILYYTGNAMLGRLKKREQMYKFSHHSDWTFLIMLFLTALTGILLHIFRLMDFPFLTNVMYVVHLAIAVPMLAIEVPFMKWAHVVYRPLALYLKAVKDKVRETESLALPARGSEGPASVGHSLAT